MLLQVPTFVEGLPFVLFEEQDAQVGGICQRIPPVHRSILVRRGAARGWIDRSMDDG